MGERRAPRRDCPRPGHAPTVEFLLERATPRRRDSDGMRGRTGGEVSRKRPSRGRGVDCRSRPHRQEGNRGAARARTTGAVGRRVHGAEQVRRDPIRARLTDPRRQAHHARTQAAGARKRVDKLRSFPLGPAGPSSRPNAPTSRKKGRRSRSRPVRGPTLASGRVDSLRNGPDLARRGQARSNAQGPA